MNYEPLTAKYDAALANLIRVNLKAHHLDIPGTVYFDEALDHLSAYYNDPRRAYYVFLEDDEVIGGIGLAEFEGFESCCELQKLYLDDKVKGHGYSYSMISCIEEKGRSLGYRKIYLETHTNLRAAIHVYEKAGYKLIERPESVVHSTMNRFYMKDLWK